MLVPVEVKETAAPRDHKRPGLTTEAMIAYVQEEKGGGMGGGMGGMGGMGGGMGMGM